MRRVALLALVVQIMVLGVAWRVDATPDCSYSCIDNGNCKGQNLICDSANCTTGQGTPSCQGQVGVTYAASTPQWAGGSGNQTYTTAQNIYCKTTTPCETCWSKTPSDCITNPNPPPAKLCSKASDAKNPNDVCAACGPSGLPQDWVVSADTCQNCQ
jgi:hypothetical protein